jgi:hypothetical protein
MSGAGGPPLAKIPLDGVLTALRSLATTYAGAQRAGDELRTRLGTIEQQRAKLLGATRNREYGTKSDRELADVERVRRTLARSSAASGEHLRALEAVISAVAADAVGAFDRPVTSRPPAAVVPGPAPSGRPDAPIRGGWSPPPRDEDPPASRRLQ